MRKVLIVRFSSLGDILQCFPAAQHFKAQGFDNVHWLTREDFDQVVKMNPFVDKTIAFKRNAGILGLLALATELRRESYDLIYDAHNNLRSHILLWILRWGTNFIRRKKHRLRRYLLFRWHWNLFSKRMLGQETYLTPIGGQLSAFSWGKPLNKQNYVALVPGAAWPLKQWPLSYWLDLIGRFPQQKFVILGGKGDDICFEIAKNSNNNQVQVLAGQLSYSQSIEHVGQAKAVVANDTGLVHAADLYNVPTIALIGPSAFGYPSSPNSHVAEVQLWCKPCSKDGRGKCKNSFHMKCMVDIRPEDVARQLKVLL